MIRVKLSKAHLHSFSKSVWYVYVSYRKPSRSSYLSSRGVDVYLTQFSEAPGVQLCLKPGGLYFQCMLLVCFLCSEFSRLIISAACFFFLPICVFTSEQLKRSELCRHAPGWIIYKKHVSVTASKSHYWDNYKMFMKHFGDVVVETTRSFGPSHLQKGDFEASRPWAQRWT